MGIARTTFLVDPEGRVARTWQKVKPEGHAAEVLAALDASRPRAAGDIGGAAPGSEETSLVGGDERSLGRKGTAGMDAAQDDRLASRREADRPPAPPMSDPPAAADRSSSTPHDWRPARFMVIAAHPDDAEFGPAGTAAGWIAAGSVGWLVCCTSGDQGGEDPDADPSPLPRFARPSSGPRRRSSATRASRSCISPTARSPTTWPCASCSSARSGPSEPDAVLATDPEALFYSDGGVNHTDHRAAGFAAVDAAYPAARNPMAFPSLARGGLAAHRVRRLYLFWSTRPTRLGRHLGDARAQDRGPRRPREPDPRAGGARRADPRGPAKEGRADRRQGRGSAAPVVIDDDEDEGPG